MARYINSQGGGYLSPDMQYFGLQNPYGNPNYQAFQSYFGPTPLLATTGNLPPSAAVDGEGPEGNKVGSDADPRTPGRQGPASVADGNPFNEDEDDNKKDEKKDDMPPEIETQLNRNNQELRDFYSDFRADTMRALEMSMDPERHRKFLEAGEPYYTRIAQRKQKMGLENIEAAGKAAFNYKYGPQMMMTAAASRAAYYPELVRAASDSYTGLDLASAMKPRMSGYYRGLI